VSIVKVNAVEVPPEGAEEFERRFAQRAGAVEHADGFEAFELLRPADGETTWFVYTRWIDDAAFEAWVASQDFAKAHAHVVAEAEGKQAPVAHGARLFSFEVVERKLGESVRG
jgi:heme-degrading monooxygenase HmoA